MIWLSVDILTQINDISIAAVVMKRHNQISHKAHHGSCESNAAACNCTGIINTNYRYLRDLVLEQPADVANRSLNAAICQASFLTKCYATKAAENI